MGKMKKGSGKFSSAYQILRKSVNKRPWIEEGKRKHGKGLNIKP